MKIAHIKPQRITPQPASPHQAQAEGMALLADAVSAFRLAQAGFLETGDTASARHNQGIASALAEHLRRAQGGPMVAVRRVG